MQGDEIPPTFRMAAKLKRVADHVICPICCQLFESPKVLPCQHSYCEGCFVKMEKYNKISCPECRRIAAVPSNGVKCFPTNFTLTHLIDDFF